MEADQDKGPAPSSSSKRRVDGTRRVRRRRRKDEHSSSSSGASRSQGSGTSNRTEHAGGTPGRSGRPPKTRRSGTDQETEIASATPTPSVTEAAREDVTQDQATAESLGAASAAEPPAAGFEHVAGTEPMNPVAKENQSAVGSRPPPSKLSPADKGAQHVLLAAPPAGAHATCRKAHKEEAPAPKCTAPFVVLCSLIAVAVLSAWVLLFARFIADRPKNGGSVCRSTSCTIYSRWLLESMNDSIDPCQDFAGHVCHGWNKKRSLSVREETFMAAFDRMSRLVRTIIIPDVGQNRLQSAARLYRSCDRVLKGERDELQEVKEALRQAGIVWPAVVRRYDTLHLLLHVALRLHWSVMLPMGVTQQENGVDVVFHYPTDLISMVNKYVEIKSTPANEVSYVRSLSDAFGANSNGAAESLQDIEEMLQDEEYAIITLYKDYATSSEPQPVKHSVLYSTVPGLTEARWKSVLSLFGIITSGSITFRTELTTYVPAFFKVWKDIGDRAMHVLLSWMTVQLAALFANRRLILNFFGVKDAELRYGAWCFSKAYILSGNAVFSAYIRNMLAGDARAQAEDMTLAVRQSFYERLRHWSAFSDNHSFIVDWNYTGIVFRIFDDAPDGDDSGDAGSRRKPTADMTDSLVQNWIDGAGPLSSTSSSASHAAIENLRFYMWMNDTVLLPYVFAFPLFDRDATVEVNYAGAGAELARATSEYLVRTYKDDHPVEGVKQFMECVTNFSTPRAANSAAVNAIAAGPLLDAYRKHSQVTLRRLPGLERYVGEKLFFVAYCYTKCLGSSAGVADEADCNEILRHVRGFARVFACPPGTPMNPAAKRCELF